MSDRTLLLGTGRALGGTSVDELAAGPQSCPEAAELAEEATRAARWTVSWICLDPGV